MSSYEDYKQKRLRRSEHRRRYEREQKQLRNRLNLIVAVVLVVLGLPAVAGYYLARPLGHADLGALVSFVIVWGCVIALLMWLASPAPELVGTPIDHSWPESPQQTDEDSGFGFVACGQCMTTVPRGGRCECGQADRRDALFPRGVGLIPTCYVALDADPSVRHLTADCAAFQRGRRKVWFIGAKTRERFPERCPECWRR